MGGYVIECVFKFFICYEEDMYNLRYIKVFKSLKGLSLYDLE